MRAYQCDRCGQCFQPREAEFVTMQNLTFKVGDKFNKRYDNFDLCLCCSNEFKSWLKEKNYERVSNEYSR